ncbi:Gfo/Idh/MocA family oxidoreductase [Formosa sp. PL04]|uniref:Gfo/Idh/MocA family protein n=1 Tax=Formosa sp. PL04 TaxID=3081755 RepID=UPI002980E5B6|nr:Gfo/Idh/MocA family oxidoreductase [Formosa sp. PL04]MDW5288250.1 Gfo/Idh/MocA family oxidoreductase [Formosa sp. PL04]
MNKIVWGIIGCGDVAEVKSGPAFSRIEHSELKAVMRRNLAKAEDFAKRHNVKYWYDNAAQILEDPDINAVYIATPPASHLQYTLDAINAGKHVYLEKPMALNTTEAKQIVVALKRSKTKLTVAHYRRHLPAFLKVKELLCENKIGEVLFADIQILQSRKSNLIAKSDVPWRLDPKVSGGGLFHDLAPHQLDLMYTYFGDYTSAIGFSRSKNNQEADTIVNGIIQFKNGIQCRGVWSFNSAEADQKDECIIYGTEGRIVFSFFGEVVKYYKNGEAYSFNFNNPKHVQQPMISAVVDYFLGQGENPCSAEEALKVTEIMDAFTSH